MKELNLKKTVAELVNEYPEVSEIMVDLGFKDITSSAAMKFMGKVMTIPKGAAIKGIPMDKVIAAFEDKGFHITGLSDEANGTDRPLPFWTGGSIKERDHRSRL